MKKQYYEKVNKFWLVSYEIEQAPTYEKSHSVVQSLCRSSGYVFLPFNFRTFLGGFLLTPMDGI